MPLLDAGAFSPQNHDASKTRLIKRGAPRQPRAHECRVRTRTPDLQHAPVQKRRTPRYRIPPLKRTNRTMVFLQSMIRWTNRIRSHSPFSKSNRHPTRYFRDRLKLQERIQGHVMFATALRNRSRQVGGHLIEVDSRRAGLLKYLLSAVHIQNVASHQQRAKPDFGHEFFSPVLAVAAFTWSIIKNVHFPLQY